MHRIKIPKVIKLGIYPYKVTYQSNLKMDDGYAGVVNHRKLLIEIDPVQAKVHKDETLIHEVVHIIGNIHSIHLQEDDVDRIAQGMSEFLFNVLEVELDWSCISENVN